MLLILAFLLIPILILSWIGNSFIDLFKSKDSIRNEKNEWVNISSDSILIIKFKWVNINEIPDFINKYFEERPIMILNSEPKVEYLEGYFTDFKVERTDGVFLQKINFDSEKGEIISAPLFFLKYESQEIEEIIDLKNYDIDTKGYPNNFILSAMAEGHEIEIHLKKE